jgi:pimeloyl-ACP methyl ester carboxylesterase
MPRITAPAVAAIASVPLVAPLLPVPEAIQPDIELEYETHGDPSHPAVVLIHGLNSQLINWPPSVYLPLVQAGFFVVRFDNRDAGLSSQVPVHVDSFVVRQLKAAFNWACWTLLAFALLVAALALWHPVHSWIVAGVGGLALIVNYLHRHDYCVVGKFDLSIPYSLHDMANDVVALMSALRIDSFHVVGMSLGGMVAQTVAIDYTLRVRSLTSIMSHSGATGEDLQPDSTFLRQVHLIYVCVLMECMFLWLYSLLSSLSLFLSFCALTIAQTCISSCAFQFVFSRDPPYPDSERDEDLPQLTAHLAVSIRLLSGASTGADQVEPTYEGRSFQEEAAYFLARFRGSPAGVNRQTAAVEAASCRDRALAELVQCHNQRGPCPILLIHGSKDPLFPLPYAHHMADVIRAAARDPQDADLLILDVMGHDLPDQAMPQLVPRLIAHLQRAESLCAAAASAHCASSLSRDTSSSIDLELHAVHMNV